MNNWAMGFQVVSGHLDLQQRAEDVSEAEEGDLAAGDFARAPENLCFGMRKFTKQMLVTQFGKETPSPCPFLLHCV